MRRLPTRLIAIALTVALGGACSSEKETDKPAVDKPADKPAEPVKPKPPAAATDSTECQPITDGSLDCAESERASPFTCVRYNSDCSIDVQLQDKGPFLGLVAIDGIPVETLVTAARTGCKDGARNWKKRLAEDLSEVMKASCGNLGGTVDLSLRDGDQVVERKGVASTDDNRSALKSCWEKVDKCGQQ